MDRYHRQSLLPVVTEAGQVRIRSAHAFVAGCGALGSGLIDALARAGIGTLTIVDRDVVEWTNLQRQTLYEERHAREAAPKAVAAAERIAAINGEVTVHPFVEDLSAMNVERLADGADLILDGLDNFETRYLLNDHAVRSGVPLIYGGAVGTSGMVMTILPHSRHRRAARRAGHVRGQAPADRSVGADGRAAGALVRWTDELATPCLRCVFPEAPPPGASPTCDTAGVLGPVVSIVAALQATQAIKLVVGDLRAVDRHLISIDAWTNEWRFLDVSAAGPSPTCPCCGLGRFDFLDDAHGIDDPVGADNYGAGGTAGGTVGSAPRRARGGTTSLCGRNAVQVVPAGAGPGRVDLDMVAARLAGHGAFSATRHMLRGLLAHERGDDGPLELTLFPDGRAIVKGTTDAERARGVYAKYVGA
ncbi:MAG: ThiF family adenylyltransferase [Phycisphaerales bacterium]